MGRGMCVLVECGSLFYNINPQYSFSIHLIFTTNIYLNAAFSSLEAHPVMLSRLNIFFVWRRRAHQRVCLLSPSPSEPPSGELVGRVGVWVEREESVESPVSAPSVHFQIVARSLPPQSPAGPAVKVGPAAFPPRRRRLLVSQRL